MALARAGAGVLGRGVLTRGGGGGVAGARLLVVRGVPADGVWIRGDAAG